MRSAWLTDIHLEFLRDKKALCFVEELAVLELDGLFLTGDISTAGRLESHVPPFKESCRHEGKISADDWLPHFSCKAVGDVLQKFISTFPDRRMTVLCGHTHSSSQVILLPNLLVKTGGAEYGLPEIQEILEILETLENDENAS